MCIIIDTNAFASVFSKSSKDHKEFACIFDWVRKNQKAKFVYGGDKYYEELWGANKYFDLLENLRMQGSVQLINHTLVNQYQLKLKAEWPEDFNDTHLAAIVEVSGCRLICTKEEKARKYLEKEKVYCNSKVPKIFRSKNTDRDLLCNDHIVELKNTTDEIKKRPKNHKRKRKHKLPT